MKTKYHSVNLYATQGGGTAVSESDICGNRMSIGYYFHQVPNWGDFKVGDMVPHEWGIQYCGQLVTMLPKEPRNIESRARREGSHQKRHSYWNRKRKVTRMTKKTARLSFKGTLRSVTKARIDEVMHFVGVIAAKEERQSARRDGLSITFYKGDQLRAVDIDDCDEGLRLGDICVMQDTNSLRGFIIVKIRRNGKLKQLETKRFILHKRFIENE